MPRTNHIATYLNDAEFASFLDAKRKIEANMCGIRSSNANVARALLLYGIKAYALEHGTGTALANSDDDS